MRQSKDPMANIICWVSWILFLAKDCQWSSTDHCQPCNYLHVWPQRKQYTHLSFVNASGELCERGLKLLPTLPLLPLLLLLHHLPKNADCQSLLRLLTNTKFLQFPPNPKPKLHQNYTRTRMLQINTFLLAACSAILQGEEGQCRWGPCSGHVSIPWTFYHGPHSFAPTLKIWRGPIVGSSKLYIQKLTFGLDPHTLMRLAITNCKVCHFKFRIWSFHVVQKLWEGVFTTPY